MPRMLTWEDCLCRMLSTSIRLAQVLMHARAGAQEASRNCRFISQEDAISRERKTTYRMIALKSIESSFLSARHNLLAFIKWRIDHRRMNQSVLIQGNTE